MKLKSIICITFILTILFSSNIYSESNGIWTKAEDIRPGVFGLDENSVAEFRFENLQIIKDLKLSRNSKITIGDLNQHLEFNIEDLENIFKIETEHGIFKLKYDTNLDGFFIVSKQNEQSIGLPNKDDFNIVIGQEEQGEIIIGENIITAKKDRNIKLNEEIHVKKYCNHAGTSCANFEDILNPQQINIGLSDVLSISNYADYKTISGLKNPVFDSDAATKFYVDSNSQTLKTYVDNQNNNLENYVNNKNQEAKDYADSLFNSLCGVTGTSLILKNGASMTFYSRGNVDANDNCDNYKKVRTCNSGTLSESNSYNIPFCYKDDYKNCGAIQHGGTKTFYKSSSVPYGQSCQSQNFVCNDGNFYNSGYPYESCSVQPGQSCSYQAKEAEYISGNFHLSTVTGTIYNGGSLNFYSISVCDKYDTPDVEVKCNNGVLSKSTQNLYRRCALRTSGLGE